MMCRQGWIVSLYVLLFTPLLAQAETRTMTVQVRETQVRATPSFLGAIVASVKYGDALNVLESGDQWYRVEVPGTSRVGWIHASALTAKRLQLRAGQQDVSAAASSGELALAGKGFNAAIESEFRRTRKDVDYTWVDRVERLNASIAEIRSFLEEGELHPQTGGSK